LAKQIKLLAEAGANVADVVSVKAYITDMSKGGDAGKAYSEFFKEVKPLFTMVGTPALNRPTQVVEIELIAIVSE
jgi:enamine deaminase RidA (YjgF/YER057c/UK114 family)